MQQQGDGGYAVSDMAEECMEVWQMRSPEQHSGAGISSSTESVAVANRAKWILSYGEWVDLRICNERVAGYARDQRLCVKLPRVSNSPMQRQQNEGDGPDVNKFYANEAQPPNRLAA